MFEQRISMDAENVFSRVLNFQLKGDTASSQFGNIKLLLSVQWQKVPNSVHSQQLVISLTDESDPLFLYILHLSEDSFQNLKLQQGLLVDFLAFPQSLTDLLELCSKHENTPSPKYLLTLNFDQKPSQCAKTAQLEIIETNSFKHLTHLFLKLHAPNDSEAKQYLSVCFQKLKQEKQKIESRLNFVENDLRGQLQTYQETISAKTKELHALQDELNNEISSKSNKYAEEFHHEKEKLLKLRKDEKEKWEKQRKEKDQSHRKEMKDLEMKNTNFEIANNKLYEENQILETTRKELKSQNESFKEDIKRLQEQLSKAIKDNDILVIELEEKEAPLNQMEREEIRLKNLLGAKDEAISQLESELDKVMNKMNSCENLSEQKQIQLEKSLKRLKQLAEDVAKANDIIKKYQGDAHIYREKLNMRGKLVVKQEELIAEKSEHLKKAEKELSALKSQTKDQKTQITLLEDNVTMLQNKTQEYESDIRKKDYTIKELSQRMLGISAMGSNQCPSNLNTNKGQDSRSSAEQFVNNVKGQGNNQDGDILSEDDSLILAVYGNRPVPVPIVNHQQQNPNRKTNVRGKNQRGSKR